MYELCPKQSISAVWLECWLIVCALLCTWQSAARVQYEYVNLCQIELQISNTRTKRANKTNKNVKSGGNHFSFSHA